MASFVAGRRLIGRAGLGNRGALRIDPRVFSRGNEDDTLPAVTDSASTSDDREREAWLRSAGFDVDRHGDLWRDLGPHRVLARVCEDQRTLYRVWTGPASPPDSDAKGHDAKVEIVACQPELLRDARKGTGLRPVVGDWVMLERSAGGDTDRSIVGVLPRKSSFVRRRAGSGVREQVLAANVDRVFVVTGLDHDFNPRRLERYMSLANDAGVDVTVVLSKVDLVDHDARVRAQVEMKAFDAVQTVFYSKVSEEGLEHLTGMITPGTTTAVLGSSGVGKSTLINRLVGRDSLAVGAVRRDGKGRHTTTTRNLVRTRHGGLIIDTPGLRELGLWAAEAGVAETFSDLAGLARECRFDDCRHRVEPGCAIREAVESGRVASDRAEHYIKLREELDDQRGARGRGGAPRSRAASRGRGGRPKTRSQR